MKKVIGSRIDFSDINNTLIQEFHENIADLLEIEEVQQLKKYEQHMNTSRFQHSINVAYYTFLICRKFNWKTKEATRAALLHDLFLYDWRENKDLGWHPSVHPKQALLNSLRICDVTPLMEDCIVKHMWPMTLKAPRYKEGWVVSGMDKYCAILECVHQSTRRLQHSAAFIYLCAILPMIHID